MTFNNSMMATTEVSVPYNVVLADNYSMEQEYYGIFRHPVYMTVLYSLAYSSISIIALLGNMMVVAVVWRNHRMHTVTNYFIANLAIADIMVALICLPMTLLSNIYNAWHFGWFMCKATPYLQGVSVCASVNTLAAIAVDRYLAICHTLGKKISKKACKIIIICIWIEAFTIMIPWAVFYQLVWWKNEVQVMPLCFEQWSSEVHRRSYFLGAIFLGCYSVPLVLIVACYFLIGVRVWKRRAPGAKNTSLDLVHKSKVKAVKMLAVVVTLFAFSWLPLYVIRLKREFYGDSLNPEMQRIVGDIINPIAQWLGSSNSGMNPIIYCFFSKRYRSGFKDAITCCKNRDYRLQRRALAISNSGNNCVNYMNGGSLKTRAALVYNDKSPDKSNSDSNNAFV